MAPPAHAGDVPSVAVEVVETRPGDDPSSGHARVAVTTTNGDDGETVLTMDGLGSVGKRGSG